ncbi:thioesterase family protein [Sandaracinus amylolyticus]|uniref:TesB-like acyl-CoA thioesterase 3 n=1 Tax=Sandaracinus amylolyticus TaxID=927083 RepID=A0A0F6W2Z8_9BACT|nr:thioesterase family protein [Sandaracinus amylolyticus]AKF06156.1 TesB-like acyl-CoA thioesterase 3 [Sandaracinus amylolyticus]
MPPAISELDGDTAIEPIGPLHEGRSRFATTLTDRWSIGTAPNGGYLAVVAARALGAVLPHPDPFSASTHFLSPARPGPAEIAVEIVRAGKGHSTGEARLFQEGREVLRMIATFGDLGALDASAPTAVTSAPPELPPIESCERSRPAPSVASIGERLDIAIAPGTLSWLSGAHNERAELAGWVRLRDGRAPDALSLLFFADAFPPPVLNLSVVRTPWVPTLELTVHVRARPAPGWLRASFRTRALMHGYLEEDGEIWDEQGTLVAMSRQLARVQRF